MGNIELVESDMLSVHDRGTVNSDSFEEDNTSAQGASASDDIEIRVDDEKVPVPKLSPAPAPTPTPASVPQAQSPPEPESEPEPEEPALELGSDIEQSTDHSIQ